MEYEMETAAQGMEEPAAEEQTARDNETENDGGFEESFDGDGFAEEDLDEGVDGEPDEAHEEDDRKPTTDREWGEWRKKTEAMAEAIAQRLVMQRQAEWQSRGQPQNEWAGAAAVEEGQHDDEAWGTGHTDAPELLDALARQLQQVEHRALLEVGDRILDEQIREIGKLDAGIRCFEDLVRMPGYAAFDRLVRRGQDLVSAYRAVNHERLAGRQAAAARQATLNRLAGTSHLTRLRGGADSDGSVEIPGAALPLWQEMFPDDSPRKLKERYNLAGNR